MDLSRFVIALLGGDGREIECARQAQAEGASVRLCGFPAERDPAGVSLCGNVTEAVTGAHIVICPIPLPQPDGSLYAPQSETRLIVDSQSLAGMIPGGLLITGLASSQMKEAAAKLNLKLREYEQDEELMILRAPAIAEGAIRVAIEHTEVTLHKNRCLIVGFGKIGPALARTLLGMGAEVTVAARNPVQRARAWEQGCSAVSLDQLASAAQQAKVIFNIASALLLNRDLVGSLDKETLLIDLAAPPGGIDFEAAQDSGLKAIWARGLGGRAPRTVGRVQWKGIKQILEEELGNG
jgi:dipicolinate synthase subunit A